MKRRMAQAGLAVALAGTGILGVFASPAGAPHVTDNPQPHTKDSCKQDGWTTFQVAGQPIYKNQGQCIKDASD